MHPMQTVLPLGRRDRNGREGSLLPQGLDPTSGRLWWELWSPAGHSLQPVLWAPRSQAGPRQGELEGPEEKAHICLLPHSPPDDHHRWLNGTTDGRWLTTVVCGRGPVSTNGWTEPLTVTQWQLAPWGRGPPALTNGWTGPLISHDWRRWGETLRSHTQGCVLLRYQLIIPPECRNVACFFQCLTRTCCSVTTSWPTLCNPVNYSMAVFPVLHYLLEFAQTHVHWLVMPSNHLILCHTPSSPALSLSHHQGLFQWVRSLHQVAKVLELQH